MKQKESEWKAKRQRDCIGTGDESIIKGATMFSGGAGSGT